MVCLLYKLAGLSPQGPADVEIKKAERLILLYEQSQAIISPVRERPQREMLERIRLHESFFSVASVKSLQYRGDEHDSVHTEFMETDPELERGADEDEYSEIEDVADGESVDSVCARRVLPARAERYRRCSC